jgi:hypothetical protein
MSLINFIRRLINWLNACPDNTPGCTPNTLCQECQSYKAW